MNDKATSRDHRLALGLCIVLALVLAGAPLGVWVARSVRQQQAGRAITTPHFPQQASILYAYQLNDNLKHIDDPPPGPIWVRSRLGLDFVTTVRGVNILFPGNAGLALLQEFPQLRLLYLHDSQGLTEDGFEQLEKLQQLEELHLTNISIDDHALAVLRKLPQLRTVRMYRYAELTDEGLDEISQIAGLITLGWQACGGITNRGVARLSRLPRLRELCIDFNYQLTDEVLWQLGAAPSLRKLALWYDSNRTAGGLKSLDRFAALEEFGIALSDELVGGDLLDFPPLPNLKEFWLSQCRIVTPRGFACLERMPNLERLELRPVAVDDAMLASIGRLKQLRSLRLDDCVGLSKAGLAHLAGLDRLETLEVHKRDPGRLDPAAIAALRKSLPHCEIWYDDAE